MNGFLLDTNVVSELMRPKPEPCVVSWVRSQTTQDLFLSAMTIGELMRGARKLGDTRRGATLQQWVKQDIVLQFKQRIIAFDLHAALQWGIIMGESDAEGGTLPAADAQIAAVAIVNKLTVVTRNVKDFERMLDVVINPFEPSLK